jgi:hypothetical protein
MRKKQRGQAQGAGQRSRAQADVVVENKRDKQIWKRMLAENIPEGV